MRTALTARRGVGLIVSAGLVLGSIQSGNAFAAQDPDDQVFHRSLAAWDAFDVDASPRPFVLLQHPRESVVFRSSADRVAYRAGRWKLPRRLPSAPRTLHGYPIISASQALTYQRHGKAVSKRRGHRVVVESIKLHTSTYYTDRGPVMLPAWRVKFAGAKFEPTEILALAPGSYVHFKGWYAPATLDKVEYSEDGRELLVHYVGAEPGTGPCQAEYTAGVRETEHAVGLAIVELPKPESTPGPTPRPGTAFSCSTMGYIRTLKVTLDAPLGARVVVDGRGGFALPQVPQS